MRQFLIRLIIFSSIFFSLLLLFVIANYRFIDKLDLVNNKNKSILLLGDSNMECAVNDKIFSRSINMAASSDSYYYSYLKLNHYITKKIRFDTLILSFAPQNIIDNGWLFDSKHIYSRLQHYYPLMSGDDLKVLYSNNYKGVNSAIPAVFKRSILNIVKIILHKDINGAYGGFLKLNRNILSEVQLKLKKGEPLPFFNLSKDFKISPTEIKYLEKIISLCQNNNITLILMNTPKRHEILEHPNYSVLEFNDFYAKNFKNILFVDCSRLNLPDDNYGDLVHLNFEGASSFSNILQSQGLQNIINEYKVH